MLLDDWNHRLQLLLGPNSKYQIKSFEHFAPMDYREYISYWED